jgi:hypothetical protein
MASVSLPLSCAATIGVYLLLRGAIRALRRRSITIWLGYYWWWGNWQTVDRSDDALGFWIVVGALFLFAALLTVFDFILLMGTLISLGR